jgi:hypothetical protein
MFAMGGATRIYVATGATDMRKSFSGLEGLIRERWTTTRRAATFFIRECPS